MTGYTAVRDSAEFLAMNPNRLIPVMIDPGAPDSEGKSLVLYESMAICQHIAAKFGGPLAGQNAHEVARISMWALWAMTSCETPLLTMVFDRGEDTRAKSTALL